MTETDQCVLAAVADGLSFSPRPYADIGRRVGVDEETVIAVLRAMLDAGTIKRLGLVARHRELGYRANAMVVWDVPDDHVDEVGRRVGAVDFVTLCYRRARRPPHWRYNLFSMIHGRDRATVLAQADELARLPGLADTPRDVLFSRRRFKQRGARYARPPVPA
ncbi:MAG: AsnC family protein [Rhodospirillales bacterium]|nr:AsnC family protein [Rhodospirillales bacterium]